MFRLIFVLSISLLTLSAQAADVVSCNDGAMVVTSGSQGKFNIEIRDRGVVDYFQSRIAQTPKGAAVDVTLTAGGTLLVSGFVRTGTQSFGTGQFGPTFEMDGRGGKLSLTYFDMTSSHSYDAYEIANWYFESCISK